MKFNKPMKKATAKRKSSAQAMVEFAIALPILLLLLYGLLETGRYLFLYSTVVNSSRQAVRYGSATGIGNNNVPRYQDCLGILNAARAGAYIANFDTITIAWDDGPADTTPTQYCTSGDTDTSLNSTILGDNNHRISVTVAEPYVPLVPRLVPFVGRTITATSSRTVLLSVSIEVTAASTLIGNTPIPATMTFTSTVTPSFTPIPPTATATFTPVTLTATASRTPTKTPIPPSATNTGTATKTGTATNTPTATATDVPACILTHGAETISNKSFSMKISNPTTTTLSILDITVYWNNTAGGGNPNNAKLDLESVYLDIPSSNQDKLVWSQNPGANAASFRIIPSGITLEPGTSTIIFNFSQSYAYPNNTERIYINIANNGCRNYPIDSDTTPTVP